MYLAQASLATVSDPTDEATLSEFKLHSIRLQEIASQTAGCISQFAPPSPFNSSVRTGEPQQLFLELSVWRDRESLDSFLQSPAYADFLQVCENQSDSFTGYSIAAWWISEKAVPTTEDARVALALSPNESENVLRFVTDREHTVWQAVIDRDGSALSKLFAEDYLEITLCGKRVMKNLIVEESPKSDEISAYQIDAAEAVVLGAGTLLLSYHVTIEGRFDGEPILPKDRWATSIWRRDLESWTCCFFQQSPYPLTPK